MGHPEPVIHTEIPGIEMPRRKKANREKLLEIARSWVPTPWEHQGRLKGVGVDCAGFIAEVAYEGGYKAARDFESDYRLREDGQRMLELLTEHLDLVVGSKEREPIDMSKAQLMDIIAFCDEDLREPEITRHLAFYAGAREDGILGRVSHYIIHAGGNPVERNKRNDNGIIEHRMDLHWLRRAHSIWTIRGIDG